MSFINRYTSEGQYRLDTCFHNPSAFNPPHLDNQYSAGKFTVSYVPSNSQNDLYPSEGSFDETYLKQTDVLKFINRAQQPQLGLVSLAKKIRSYVLYMGKVCDLNGSGIGTCTLIAKNLVIMARHAIAGKSIYNFEVRFGYTYYQSSYFEVTKARLDYVYEESRELDYAIVKLQHPLKDPLTYPQLNITEDFLSSPALLHYPLGKPLKVSVAAFDQTLHTTFFARVFHDTDYFSSGGAYINSSGDFTAMHLGAELDGDKMHVSRYAITLRKIVNHRPNSLLAVLAKDPVCQAKSYSSLNPKYQLKSYLSNFFIDEEGYKSKKILTNLFKKEITKNHPQYDKHISLKDNLIEFTKRNLDYIKKTYPVKFKKFLDECIGVSGKHKTTHDYSVAKHVESDHTLPYKVWDKTTNPVMQAYIQGTGKRPGEFELPAITLPYEKHRALLTTNNSTATQQFTASLTNLCDLGKVDEALIKCFEEYQNKGIDLDKSSVNRYVKECEKMDVITKQQRKGIIKRFYP